MASNPEALSSAGLYSFSISSAGGGAEGYEAVGNVTAYTDSVNGTWNFSYDTLNQLANAGSTQVDTQAEYPYPNYCWQYDDFGNRLWQTSSATAYAATAGGPNACTVTAGPSSGASYNASNQISDGLHQYDPAGNMYQDATTGNSYLYDGEGRICAVSNTPVAGITTMTQYLYDAEGNRVAKGTITSMSCDISINSSTQQPNNGFTMTQTEILGPGNEQLTELDWTGASMTNWHTNVYAASGLVGTYSPNLDPQTSAQQPIILNFYLTDWLGTRRVTTDAAGNVQAACLSLPYGNGETCTATPTEHLFTQHERDAESGNDYFGARYYASSMGRFLIPDWSAKEDPVPYASLGDPQTLNLYAYMRNNPLAGVDADGHDSGVDEQMRLVEENQAGLDAEMAGYEMQVAAAMPLSAPGAQQQTPLGGAPPAPKAPTEAYEPTSKDFSGGASYYNLPGQKTASGEKFDPNGMTAAMTGEKAKLGQTVTVSYTTTDKDGKTVTTRISVVVNDRGPFNVDSGGRAVHPLEPHPTRVIDLTPAAFTRLVGGRNAGVVQVRVTVPNE